MCTVQYIVKLSLSLLLQLMYKSKKASYEIVYKCTQLEQSPENISHTDVVIRVAHMALF